MATYTTAWLNFQSLSQSGAGNVWTDVAQSRFAGPSYEAARSTLDKSSSSALLYISNVAYPTIDPADTLVGIEFRFTRQRVEFSGGLGTPVDSVIRLSTGGSSNLSKPSVWPDTATVETYGGASNLWGTSLTTADLDSALGIELQVTNTSAINLITAIQRDAQIRFTFDDGGAAGLTATLAAQETGSDTASGSLGVVVSGSLSVQEAGQDTASGSLGVSVSASLTAQEVGSDTASGTATVLVYGTLAAQEAGQDTFSATATVGPAPITATLAAQEVGSDTFAGALGVGVSATLAAQEVGSDTFTGALGSTVSGSLTVQEIGSDTFAGSATLGPAPITATLAAQEVGADTAAGLASALVSGSLAVQEVGPDVFSGSAAVALSATLDVQELGSDTFAGIAFTIQPSARRFAFPGQAKNGGQVATQAKSSIISQGRAGVVLYPNNGGQILDHARSGRIVGA